MSSLDWPSVDANGVSLPTIVSSTDLFDGEIFGDELMDIYNSAVVGENSSESNEIPQLLPPTTTSAMKKEETDESVKIAAAAAAIDDGLGAFRPSTSFSDLTTLLTPTPETVSSSSTAEVPAPVTSSVDPKSTKKRSCPPSSADPTAKRKATAPKVNARRVSAITKKQDTKPNTESVNSPVSVVQTDAQSEKPGTPDPLVVESSGAHVVPPALPEVSPVTVPKETIKVVVSPSVPAKEVASSAEATSAAESALAVARQSSVSPTTTTNTEADFKSIAQVAVSNLMMSATTTKAESPAGAASNNKVDTSTDHIKALTGNNWVAACSSTTPGLPPPSQAAESKANNRARRQNLTPDERARQNRDRNREHARNTRLRKKAYVEELKRTLTELVAQRDAAEFEKRQAAQRELEQREVRFRVIEEFLKLRGRNETNFARWAAILEDGFSLTLPLTDFRKAVQSATRSDFDQVLHGVSDVMADSSSFADFLQSLGNGNGKGVVSFQYNCDRNKFFMDGCNAFLEWTATSVGAVSSGASSEMSLKGLVRGKFSPASNKLLSASMTFDTGSIIMQMQSQQVEAPASAAADIAAAQAADAILDSLQMPRLAVPVPSAVNVVYSSSSTGSVEKGELDSDESVNGDKSANEDSGVSGSAVSCSD